MKSNKVPVLLGITLVMILGMFIVQRLHPLAPAKESSDADLSGAPTPKSPLLSNGPTLSAPPNNGAANSEAATSTRNEILNRKQDKLAARQLARTHPRLQASGPSIVLGTETYRAVPGLIAAQNPEPNAKVIARIGNYRITESAEGGSNLQSYIPTAPPVVTRSSDGKLAIVTGIVDVELRTMSEANDVARDAGLDVAQESPGLARVFLKVRAGSSIPDILTKLRSDARVKSVELDILDSAAVAR